MIATAPNRAAPAARALLRPSGLRVGCRSDFGVRDLHGGAWEWTRSTFNRGRGKGLATVRGGNDAAGELVGRCAHAVGRAPDQRAAQIGFRCCEGANVAPDVELVVLHQRKLEARDKLDRELARRLLEALPDEARADLSGHGPIEPSRMWSWWPMGNDPLLVMSICAGSGRRAACGIAIARVVLGRPIVLAWAEGGSWDPMLDAENDPRTRLAARRRRPGRAAAQGELRLGQGDGRAARAPAEESPRPSRRSASAEMSAR